MKKLLLTSIAALFLMTFASAQSMPRVPALIMPPQEFLRRSAVDLLHDAPPPPPAAAHDDSALNTPPAFDRRGAGRHQLFVPRRERGAGP
jgi:hypothetical protein